MPDKMCHVQRLFRKTRYSHISETREAGEGKCTDTLQHVVLQYDTKVVGSGEKRNAGLCEEGEK